MSGIIIAASTNGLKLDIEFQSIVYSYGSPTTFLEDKFREWNFLAITYNPTSTKKVFGAVNNEYIDQFTILSISTQGKEQKTTFGRDQGQLFMLDDIVFFPKYSTERELSAIYNSSK